MNPEILELFCQSVSEVGLFSWWSQSQDGKFQIEFAGTQLWMPPLEPQEPPCGTIALRFEGEVLPYFLRRELCRLPENWAQLLQADEMGPIRLSPGSLILQERQGAASWLEEVNQGKELATAGDLLERPIRLRFWAGQVGLAVAAQQVFLVSHQGDLDWQVLPQMVSRWWSYWERYWKLRGTEQAQIWDYACEATVPAER